MTVLTIGQTHSTSTSSSRQDARELSDSQSRTEGEVRYVFHPATGQLIEIDPEQSWFWTPEWQAGERMVERDLQLGRYEDFDNIDEFLEDL